MKMLRTCARRANLTSLLLLLLLMLKQTRALEIGDSCKILDQSGVCTDEEDCFTLEHLVLTKLIRNRHIPRCGVSEYGEVICCPTNTTALLRSLAATTLPTNTVDIKPEPRLEKTTSNPSPIPAGNVGDSCSILDLPGICTEEEDCFILEHLVLTKLIRNRHIPRCGVSLYGEVICCPTNTTAFLRSLGATTLPTNTVDIEPEPRLEETTSKPRPTPAGNDVLGAAVVPSDVRPAVKACREYEDYAKSFGPAYQTHILNGVRADFGEYPYMGAIGYRTDYGNVKAGELDFNCGATLIARRFVLTAAHCVASKILNPEVVRFNFTDFTDSEQQFIDIPINKSRIFAPKEYIFSKTYHDIAVIELEREVPLSRFCRPTCLSTAIEHTENQPVLATGWGITSTLRKNKSDVLLKVDLKIQPLSQCNETILKEGKTRHLDEGIIPTQLCAFDPNEDPNKKGDTCDGDSGGALIEVVDEVHRLYRTIGVVSSGFSCGTETAGLYTRVSAYLNFIEDIVWPQT